MTHTSGISFPTIVHSGSRGDLISWFIFKGGGQAGCMVTTTAPPLSFTSTIVIVTQS